VDGMGQLMCLAMSSDKGTRADTVIWKVVFKLSGGASGSDAKDEDWIILLEALINQYSRCLVSRSYPSLS
jgi:hypothetical protein